MDGSSNRRYRRVSRKWSNISQTLTTTGTTNGTVVYTITPIMDVLDITRTIVTPSAFHQLHHLRHHYYYQHSIYKYTHALQLELQEQRLLWDYLQGYSSILLRIPLQLVVRQLGTVHLYYSINRWFVVQ
jgi:hypothetical protein